MTGVTAVDAEHSALECPECMRTILVEGPGVRKLQNKRYSVRSKPNKKTRFRKVTSDDLKADDGVTAVPDYDSKMKKIVRKQKKSNDKEKNCEVVLTARMAKNIRKKAIELVCRGKRESFERFIPLLAELFERRKMPKLSEVREIHAGKHLRIPEKLAERVFAVFWQGKLK